ncbi:transmembrane protein 8B [Thrips palmi]|uniref:Transmembrane protein 8B n=1 Tax=Thrips palmi TaxID=161013 RepID=A0A6P9A3B3_THRPL|nr:transmembrane protein 8B [Thrips palmi]
MWRIGLVILLCTNVGYLSASAEQNVAGEKTVMLSHLMNRQVFEYRAYKDVQIFHYDIPEQVSKATWNFSALPTNLNRCDVRDVSVYLKYGSYPVINPDGAEYPSHFRIHQSPIYDTIFISDGSHHTITVTSPTPGDWYAVAFLPITRARITQKGLFPNCTIWFESSLSATIISDVIVVFPEVQAHQEIQLYQEIENASQTYKFYVPADTWAVQVNVSRCSAHGVPKDGKSDAGCPLVVMSSGRSLPNPDHPGTATTNCSNNGPVATCQQEWVPWEEQWHYLTIAAPNHHVGFTLKVLFQSCAPEYPLPRYLLVNDLDTRHICSSINKTSKLRVIFRNTNNQSRIPPPPNCFARIPLMRKTYGGNFLFEFDQLPFENGSSPLKAYVSTLSPTLMSFEIRPSHDIGGTLNFEVGLDPFLNTSYHNVSLVACLTHGVRSEVLPDRCTVGASLHVNSSSSLTVSRVSIPYPEPGLWYITMQAFCYLSDPLLNHAQIYIDCPSNKTAVYFGLASGSCVFGSCGRYGRCHQYISSGFIFSTCVCSVGYRGWGCTDDKKALSSSELLMGSLLLTLSNLFFIPAIIVALRRKFFTEALLYCCTMFFSTFYHACDEEGYSFCLMRLSVMQFCDFYSAILSFWLTLISMADLGHTLTSLLHMGGAVGVALGVVYDQTGLWVFLVPALSGIFIIMLSWASHMRRKKGCYPQKTYWFLCLPFGMALAAGGLLGYAFLETDHNYKFVHSAWHAAMALAIVFLLPLRREAEEYSPPGVIPSHS